MTSYLMLVTSHCQFKPQTFSIVFWSAFVPPLWKRFRHPCSSRR